jgi:hypothetical protein
MSSDRILFPELWKIILSDLSVRDLARASRASHYIRENVRSFLKSLSMEICTKNDKEAVWLTSMGCKMVNLDLSDTKVTDVSMLGDVHTLDLSGTQVKDVSKLGNAHTLNLGFTLVTDVSKLGNVHTLDLSYTHVTDVSKLGNVHTLDLSWTDVRNASKLGNVHTLDLGCTGVTDVSMLGNVHTLYLRDACDRRFDAQERPGHTLRFAKVINPVEQTDVF